jgi:hypothetical protein
MPRDTTLNYKVIGLPDDDGKYLCDCSFQSKPHPVSRRTWYTHQKTYCHGSSKLPENHINDDQLINEHNSGDTTYTWNWNNDRENNNFPDNVDQDEDDDMDESNQTDDDEDGNMDDDMDESSQTDEDEEMSEENGEEMQIDEDEEWELTWLRAVSGLFPTKLH